MTLSSITARNRSARDKKRAVFLTGVLQEKRLSFYLSDVILVNRGVAVIFDQIDGINVFIKNARLNELLDVLLQKEFYTGSAGGAELARNRHQHRFFLGAFEMTGEIHRSKVGEKGCDVGQCYHPFLLRLVLRRTTPYRLFFKGQVEIVSVFGNADGEACILRKTGDVFFCGAVV